MLIGYWRSDVCSSVLHFSCVSPVKSGGPGTLFRCSSVCCAAEIVPFRLKQRRRGRKDAVVLQNQPTPVPAMVKDSGHRANMCGFAKLGMTNVLKIGRASCRESGCQYV